MIKTIRFNLFLIAFTVATGISVYGQNNTDVEAKFIAMLKNATLKGTWAPVQQAQLGAQRADDGYRIVRVEKKEGDQWVLVSLVKFQDKEFEYPIPVVVKFAGDTAVLILDDVRAGQGAANWSARVLFHENVYAGKWWETANRDHGGTIEGTITQANAPTGRGGQSRLGGPRGGAPRGNQDPGMVFTRPSDSPGLGQALELPPPDADGFRSMFNGKDLTGWDALPHFWSVKDGAIDCVETAEEGGNVQSDLMWIDSRDHPEKYANFELQAKFRWLSHSGNSGIQFRSKMDNAATKHIAGYQADLDPGNAFDGALYDESGASGRRKNGVGGPHMGPRGYKIKYPAGGGNAQPEPLTEDAQTLAAMIKPVGGEFNEMVVVADGPHITIKINGHVFCEVIDEYDTALKNGIIALQQHAGAQMEIQFKDIKIKFLATKAGNTP